MSYPVNTLAQFLEIQADCESSMNRADVAPRVLSANVWHAIASFPGCLGDNHAVSRSREAALDSVDYWLSDNDHSARYVRGQLRRNGICYLRDGRVITLSQHAVSELF